MGNADRNNRILRSYSETNLAKREVLREKNNYCTYISVQEGGLHRIRIKCRKRFVAEV